MKLKKPLNFGRWEFYIAIGEEEVRVPVGGFAKSAGSLARAVKETFKSLDAQGIGNFTGTAEKEAAALGMGIEEYYSDLVQHQICLRAGGMKSGICNSSGLGDSIHHVAEKVDAVLGKSKIGRAISSKIGKKLFGGKKVSVSDGQPRMSGCRSCGGSRAYRSGERNLGRAGKLNRK